MNEKIIEELITKLMQTSGLGRINSQIESVSGGFLHRMYKVTTDCGTYAVKQLNKEIMARPGVHDNYARAERIERILENKNIPIVPAITIQGNKMQTVDGYYFYIFHWQEGHITDWNNISISQCYMAGNILGRIHKISPENVTHKKTELSSINWNKYLLQSKEEKSEIAAVLADHEELLIYAEAQMNKARMSLPDILCLSDEDMDPKNIMWDNGKPLVIDLESLDYGNPISHALQLALQWSGATTCNIDVEKIIAFFEGYLNEYDNGFRRYSDIWGLSYTWVEWLEYNIQRALDTNIDKTEKMMGISEVKNTINRIKYLQKNEKNIKNVLDLRLPQICCKI